MEGNGQTPRSALPNVSPSWPVTVFLSQPCVSPEQGCQWMICDFVMWMNIRSRLAWGHQAHFMCALRQIWSQRWQAGILTQCDTYYLPSSSSVKSVYLKISRTKEPGNTNHTYTKHSTNALINVISAPVALWDTIVLWPSVGRAAAFLFISDSFPISQCWPSFFSPQIMV